MSTAVSHRLSTELQTIESQHGVKSRWKISDPEYKQAEKAQASLVRSSLFEAIKACSVKRKFLLHIKAKYAGEGLMVMYIVILPSLASFVDGQKIAKRLSMQISKETAKLKKLIAEYNSCHCDEPDLILADVLEPHSTDVGRKERHDIIQAYLRKKRSEEEIKLLLAEVEIFSRKTEISNQ